MAFFLPTKTTFIFPKITHTTTYPHNVISKYSIKDSSYTIAGFLGAIIHDPSRAFTFISKNYLDKIDLAALSSINMEHICPAPLFVSKTFGNIPKNCRADTVLTLDKELGPLLLHFYTLHEPDKIANWKIYQVETERL